jgi:hypothetical protein
MNGIGVGGFAQGFTQGFGLMDAYQRNKAAEERQATQDTEAAQYRRDALGLQQLQEQRMAEQAKNSQANETTRLDLASQALGLNLSKAELDAQKQKKELELAEAANQRLEAKDKREASEDSVKLEAGQLALKQARRQAAAQERQARYQTEAIPIIDRLQTDPTFTPTPEQIQVIRETTGVEPTQWVDPKYVEGINQTFADLQAGKKGYNDPAVIELAKGLYDPYVQRDIGEPAEHDGRKFTITGKTLSGIYPVPDKPGFFVGHVTVSGKDAQGQPVEYDAPITEYGTNHPDDQVALLHGDLLAQPVLLGNMLHQYALKNPNFRKRLDERMATLSATGGKPMTAKEQAEIDARKAQAEKYRAEAEKARRPGTGGKPQYKVVDDFNAETGQLKQDIVKLDGDTATRLKVEDQAPDAKQATADQVKALYKQGKLTRAKALSRLKELGYD